MNNNYLEHHGILGQKWGVRRYQNPDGSYTAEGRERHADDENHYEVQYKRSGAYAVNQKTGKKMSKRTRRHIEKDMKKNDKKTVQRIQVQ